MCYSAIQTIFKKVCFSCFCFLLLSLVQFFPVSIIYALDNKIQTQNSQTHGKLHRTVLAVKPDMLKQNRTFLGFPFSLLIQTHFEVYKKNKGVSSVLLFPFQMNRQQSTNLQQSVLIYSKFRYSIQYFQLSGAILMNH